MKQKYIIVVLYKNWFIIYSLEIVFLKNNDLQYIIFKVLQQYQKNRFLQRNKILKISANIIIFLNLLPENVFQRKQFLYTGNGFCKSWPSDGNLWSEHLNTCRLEIADNFINLLSRRLAKLEKAKFEKAKFLSETKIENT